MRARRGMLHSAVPHWLRLPSCLLLPPVNSHAGLSHHLLEWGAARCSAKQDGWQGGGRAPPRPFGRYVGLLAAGQQAVQQASSLARLQHGTG
jgi:hypothetical protein